MDLSPTHSASSSSEERSRHESPRRKRDPSPDSASKRRTPTGTSFPSGSSPNSFPGNPIAPPSFTTPPFQPSGSGLLGSASSSRDVSPSRTRPRSQPTFAPDVRGRDGYLIGQSSSGESSGASYYESNGSARNYAYVRDTDRERLERLRGNLSRRSEEQSDVHQRIRTWTIVNELNNQPLDRADNDGDEFMARYERSRRLHERMRPPPGWNVTPPPELASGAQPIAARHRHRDHDMEQAASLPERHSRSTGVSPLDSIRPTPVREAMSAIRSRHSPTGSTSTYESSSHSSSSSLTGLPDLADAMPRRHSGHAESSRRMFEPYRPADSSGAGPSNSSYAPGSAAEPNWDISQVYQRRTSLHDDTSPDRSYPPVPSAVRNHAAQQANLVHQLRQQVQHQQAAAGNASSQFSRYRLEQLAAERLAFERRAFGYGGPVPGAETAGPSGARASPEGSRFGDIRAGRRPYASYGAYSMMQDRMPPDLLRNYGYRYAYARPRMLPRQIDPSLSNAEQASHTRQVYAFTHQLEDGEKRALAAGVVRTTTFEALQAREPLTSAGMAASLSQSSDAPRAAGDIVAALLGEALPPAREPAKKEADAEAVHWDAEIESACAVCQDDYEDESEVALTPCKHMYHAGCLKRWLETKAASTCPMCRRDMACFGMLRRMCESRDMALGLWIDVADEGGRQGWY